MSEDEIPDAVRRPSGSGFTRRAALKSVALVVGLATGERWVSAQPPAPGVTPAAADAPRLVVQQGHTFATTGRASGFAAVFAARISPDSRFIVTAGGATAILWDAETGRELRQFRGHTGEVLSVAFTPDSSRIATAAVDGTARLWDTATGMEVRRFAVGKPGAEHGTFADLTADGARLVAVQDSEIKVFDTRTGAVLQSWKMPTAPLPSPGDPDDAYQMAVRLMALSPDGRTLAIATTILDLSAGRELVLLWDMATGREKRRLVHPAELRALRFSPDGRRLATEYDGAKTAWVWDVESGRRVAPGTDRQEEDHAALGQPFGGFSSGGHLPDSLTFSPDGRTLVGGGIFLKPPPGKKAGESEVYGYFGVRFWDAETGRGTREIPLSPWSGGEVYAVHYAPSGGYLIVVTKFTVLLLSAATGAILQDFRPTVSPVLSVDFAPFGAYLATRPHSGQLRLWDLQGGTRQTGMDLGGGTQGAGLDFRFGVDYASDGRHFAEARGNQLSLGSVRPGEVSRALDIRESDVGTVNSVAFSRDSAYLYLGGDGHLARMSVSTGKITYCVPTDSPAGYFESIVKVQGVLPHPRDTYVLIWGPNPTLSDRPPRTIVQRRDARTGRLLPIWQSLTSGRTAFAFSRDGKYLAVGDDMGVTRLDAVTGEFAGAVGYRDDPGNVMEKRGFFDLAFSPDGTRLLTAYFDPDGERVSLWSMATGKELRRFPTPAGFGVTGVSYSADGQFVAISRFDGTTQIFRAGSVAEVCKLFSFLNGSWAVVAPDGRFDCADLESIQGLHWIAPDDPLRPLPLEIFQRQYYEPALLKRLLAGEKMPPLPSLTALNRVQPRVTVDPVRVAADGTATVAVAVASVTVREQVSGAQDLRLFRDGQLVGWRDGDVVDGRVEFTGIRLTRRSDTREASFTAYAFNRSLVKSDTAQHSLMLPGRPAPAAPEPVRAAPPAASPGPVGRPSGNSKPVPKPAPTRPAVGRAFVVCMGVDASEGSGLSLRFAVNDANALADSVTKRLKASGRYTEVVTLRLLAPSNARSADAITGTRADLRAVLAKLAGQEPTPEEAQRLARLSGADRLQPATPDDLLIVSFSGHGYAGDNGVFYLLPYDVGTGAGMTTERLARCISSDDLSVWLRGVDAGDMGLIVDACHSAQAVEGDGTFKPGPMGSRGLGQLAYDKRLLLLAATQAENVALESGSLGHGLLTYALVKDGLEAGKASLLPGARRLTLSGWLNYGVERVPELWEAVRAGNGRLTKGVSPSVTAAPAARSRPDLQRPALFDFSKKAGTERDPVL